MRASVGTFRTLALAALLAVAAPSLRAQVADPDPQRYAEAFETFAEWDSQNAVPAHGILFVGSSSIVRWSTAQSFPDLPVINRGFGGSQASDVIPWVEEAVIQYDPDVVVYYEGDNDVAAGKKAEQIFADVREFTEAVLAADPTTQVILLSVKPSPRRWEYWGEMQATNELMQRYADGKPTVRYVDVATPMLGADGLPMPHLYVEDRLHMTPAGYVIWDRVLGEVFAEMLDR